MAGNYFDLLTILKKWRVVADKQIQNLCNEIASL